jgi:hypothetical protein
MSSPLFEQFKNAKIKNINLAYNKAIAKLNNQYKYYGAILSNKYIKQKSTAFNKLKQQYISSLNALKKQYNNDINKIKNLIVPPNIKPGKNLSALLVGINYNNTPYKLYGCISDANYMLELLQNNNFKYMQILTDNTTVKPTKNIILSKFTDLLSNAKSGDVVFFFYSGHGSQLKDTNGDEITGMDQLICPIDFKMILDDELKNIIKTHLKPGVTLISLFDSCFSGSVLDLRYQYYDSLQNNELTENPNEIETNGQVIMLSGCNDTQTSADTTINNVERGAVTWAFIRSLQENSNLTWRQLLLNMRSLLSQHQYTQTPQLASNVFLNIDTKVFI